MVITLCGSTKFKDEFLKMERYLKSKGDIVLSVDRFSHAEGDELTKEQMDIFIRHHKEKIKLADKIFVINPNDYIGETTREEIKYAESLGKMIEYKYPHIRNKDNQQPSSINNREGSTTSQNDVGSSDSEKQDSYKDDKKVVYIRWVKFKELVNLIKKSYPPDGMTKKEYLEKISDIVTESHREYTDKLHNRYYS